VSEEINIINQSTFRKRQHLLFRSTIGKVKSDATMSRLMGCKGFDARPHGFRATFRTWVEEQTDAEYEVKEAALGHVVDSKIVHAYQRPYRLEKRRKLLKQWENSLLGRS